MGRLTNWQEGQTGNLTNRLGARRQPVFFVVQSPVGVAAQSVSQQGAAVVIRDQAWRAGK